MKHFILPYIWTWNSVKKIPTWLSFLVYFSQPALGWKVNNKGQPHGNFLTEFRVKTYRKLECFMASERFFKLLKHNSNSSKISFHSKKILGYFFETFCQFFIFQLMNKYFVPETDSAALVLNYYTSLPLSYSLSPCLSLSVSLWVCVQYFLHVFQSENGQRYRQTYG
jgi:hypothetical protein